MTGPADYVLSILTLVFGMVYFHTNNISIDIMFWGLMISYIIRTIYFLILGGIISTLKELPEDIVSLGRLKFLGMVFFGNISYLIWIGVVFKHKAYFYTPVYLYEGYYIDQGTGLQVPVKLFSKKSDMMKFVLSHSGWKVLS